MTAERIFVLAGLLAAVLFLFRWESRPVEHPPGVLVPFAPEQESVRRTEFVKGAYLLTQRARFDVRARVLSRRDYTLDAGADLAPMDLALGWGPMSDQAVVDAIRVTQGGRWYRLNWDGPEPIPRREILGNSANMHLIPANDTVMSSLEDIREGQVVRLWGYLVDATGSDGFTWSTSLTRDDTGDGSCELFYVEQVVLE